MCILYPTSTTYFIPPKSMNNELTYGLKKNVELSQTLGFVLGIIHINYLFTAEISHALNV